MVKSPKRYARQSARQRAERLHALTDRQGALLLEQLLRSRLAFELRFADDDHPRALSHQRRRIP